jgi:hypothetical protein
LIRSWRQARRGAGAMIQNRPWPCHDALRTRRRYGNDAYKAGDLFDAAPGRRQSLFEGFGRPASSMETRWKSMARGSGCGGSTRQRAASFAAARAVFNIDVAQKAANELAAMVDGRPVIWEPVSLDRYGRTVASCAVNDTDLADWLVRQGLALDWPRYSHGRFATTERRRLVAILVERALTTCLERIAEERR